MKPLTLFLVIVAALVTVFGGYLGWQKFDAYRAEKPKRVWHATWERWESDHLHASLNKDRRSDARNLARLKENLAIQRRMYAAEPDHQSLPGIIASYEMLIADIEARATTPVP